MDGRRHSVDIPISKTLLTLRRVRSLRDPSTNSLSKLSASVDNVNWEANLNGGSKKGCLVNFDPLGSKDVNLHRSSGDYVTDYEMLHGPNLHSSRLGLSKNSGLAGSVPVRTLEIEEPKSLRSNQAVICENNFFSERYCGDHQNKGLDLTQTTHKSDYLEGVDSCNEPVQESWNDEREKHISSNRKSRYRTHIRSFKATGSDVMSRVSSPSLSLSDIPLEESTRGKPLYGNEEVDGIDFNQCGCGISYCWSRTPRLRDSNLSSNVEEHPLLSGETDKRDLKEIYNGITPLTNIPRSLSLKFRPKSFTELVGQGAVVKSLLSTIANGRMNPFYIFHGPCGSGKKSASRIFAAAVNCLSLEDNKPCGVCQECVLFFSGGSRDVMEVNFLSINREERLRNLINNAILPPVSSRFKIFIVDECQLLRGAIWATLLNRLEELSRHVIFIMITSDLSKLPRSAVLRSQKYHFAKIKEADIVDRLEIICTEEGFDYDLAALDFIASKSNGSVRDAEIMLEQLSLLGKRITTSLAYELIGIVSDDELLELLALALSSDTSNTVKRARELMGSRIDPMKLISQLANIIMDILAGKCLEATSVVKRQFFERYCCSRKLPFLAEADMQQLNHALKILSETEKQLRTSKNQTTWLTVALLQLSSKGSAFADANASSLCLTSLHPRDGDFCSASSNGDDRKHLVPFPCKVGFQDDERTLESIWNRAAEICKSLSLRNFLRKQGKLASLSFKQGLAVAVLEFSKPAHISKAEKSWKLIASALQATLGCNVEIRIKLIPGSVRKYAKLSCLRFSFFSCSSPKSEQSCLKERSGDTFYSDGNKTIRNSDGNALSTGRTYTPSFRPASNKEEDESYYDFRASSEEEPEKQPSCFPRAMRTNKLEMSDTSREPQNNLAFSVPSITSSEACYCTGVPYVTCSFCKNYNRQRTNSKVNCWKTLPFPFKKALHKFCVDSEMLKLLYTEER